jgi:hypothetical protein
MKITSPNVDSILQAAEAAFLRAKYLEEEVRRGGTLPFDVDFQDLCSGNVRGSLIRFQGFSVTDRALASTSKEQVYGSIEIFSQELELVVWAMQYRGHYDLAAEEFVRDILHNTYEHGNFRGARGPAKVNDEERGLVYFNQLLSGTGQFNESFSFAEQVQTCEPEVKVRGRLNGDGGPTV